MPCTCKKERACIGIACCSIPLICICEENMFKNFEKKNHFHNMEFTKHKTQGQNLIKAFHLHITSYQTRGSQVPVIAHLVFNLTSKVDRKWGCYT